MLRHCLCPHISPLLVSRSLTRLWPHRVPPGRSSTCIFQRPVPPALTATQPLGTPVPCPQLPREPPAEGVAGKVGSPGEEAAGLGGGGFLRWGERARRGLAREGR